MDKIQEVIAKEHELVSLGGQAAAAAHSLGTPLSTIKIIAQELYDQLGSHKDFTKDVNFEINSLDLNSEKLKEMICENILSS